MKSGINRKTLNPVFHKRGKKEDNNELSKVLIEQARKSGVLNLSGRSLLNIPEKIWNLNEPDEQIDLSFVPNEKEEDAWWNQKVLTNLDLSSNVIIEIPSDLGKLYALTILDLHDNALTAIPAEIGKLEKLIKLNLSRNKLTKIPVEFFKLSELKTLNLSNNCLEEINPGVSDLYMLELLDLSNNKLTSLPSGMGFLVRLTQLLCSYNQINELPDDICSMRSLNKLDLMHNNLTSLPKDIGLLTKLKLVYAQHNDIKELPDFTGNDVLEELHLSNNFITEISTDFCERLPHLKILDLRDNKIENIPDDIALLQALIRLDLSNNTIQNIPNTLATLAHLISLQLEGNPIRSIRREVIQSGTQRILKTLRDRTKISETETILEMKKSASHIGGGDSVFPDRFNIRKNRCLVVTMKNIADVPDKVFLDAREESCAMIDFSKNKLCTLPVGLLHVAECANEIIFANNLITEIPPYISKFNRVYRLNISSNLLGDLPQEIGKLKMLRELNISNNRFQKIPKAIYEMQGLEILLARDNKIDKIDASSNCLGALKRLATLDLSNNNLDQVPPILGTLTNITTLELNGNCFRQPRHQVLAKGTDAIMSYLRDRMPVE